MWRKPDGPDWETIKYNLIRSLFQDTSLPPAVPEEAASTNSSCTPNYERLESYNPLPDLIIEVEKKTNKHDEPEEFYIELERQMKKYYMKLLKNKEAKYEDTKSRSSSSLIKNETSVATMATDTSTDEEKLEVTEDGVAAGNSIQMGSSSSGSTSVDHDHKIKTEADVHTDSKTYMDDVKRISTPKAFSKEKKKSQSSNHRNTSPICSMSARYLSMLGKIESARKTSSTVRSEEIEVMRGEVSISSCRGSLQNEVHIADVLNKSFTASDLIPSPSVEEILGASTMETQIADPENQDFKVSLDRCSTPRISVSQPSISLNISNENEKCSDENEKCSDENETASERSENSSETIYPDSVHEEFVTSSAQTAHSDSEMNQAENNTASTSIGDSSAATPNVSKKMKTDREVQTTPVEQGIDWDILKHNFFVGTPQIYNLCHCKNHKCED